VFQFYLDDSYDPPGTGIVTLAGYLGDSCNWIEYEERSRFVYKRFGIKIFHAQEFKNTKGEFEGWSRCKKEDFCIEIFNIAKSCDLVGASKSVQRSLHESFRKVGKVTHTYSALGMAFGSFTAAICDPGEAILSSRGHPTQFYVENGNTNNNGIKKIFDQARSDPARSELLL
jgi:hypothetical protein